MTDAPVLQTDRLLIRPLAIEDVGDRYLSWFGGDGANYVSPVGTLDELKSYVEEKVSKPDVLFLGIFERYTLLHIGNIKFEPVDVAHGIAVLGVFIGDPQFRGKGVLGEVVTATGFWLRNRGIREIWLGVDLTNTAAIRAYKKAGFHLGNTPYIAKSPTICHMCLTL